MLALRRLGNRKLAPRNVKPKTSTRTRKGGGPLLRRLILPTPNLERWKESTAVAPHHTNRWKKRARLAKPKKTHKKVASRSASARRIPPNKLGGSGAKRKGRERPERARYQESALRSRHWRPYDPRYHHAKTGKTRVEEPGKEDPGRKKGSPVFERSDALFQTTRHEHEQTAR